MKLELQDVVALCLVMALFALAVVLGVLGIFTAIQMLRGGK